MIDRFDRFVIGVLAALVAVLGVVIALGDRVGVPITQVSPEPGSSPAASAPILVRFGQAVVPESIEARFTTEPRLAGSFTWTGPDSVMFVPAAPLETGVTYTVSLLPGLQSASGRVSRSAYSWSFTPREPQVLFLAPADVAVRSLWRVSLAPGAAPEEIFPTEYGIYDYAASPDGTRIAVTAYNENLSTDLWLINPDGTDPQRLTECSPGICSGPAWSPDGLQIAYERQEMMLDGGGLGPSRIWIYDVLAGTSLPLYGDNQVLGYGPQWSADGRRIAFFDSNVGAIRVLERESGSSTLIQSDMGEVGVFYPDGSGMLFVDIRVLGRQFFTQLFTADFGPEGGITELLTESEEDQWPALSPDGRWLAFGRRRLDRQGGFGSQLMLLERQTGSLEQITFEEDYNNLEFEWDPNSRYILFTRFDLSGAFPQPEVWLYSLEGQTPGLRMVIENAAQARWLP